MTQVAATEEIEFAPLEQERPEWTRVWVPEMEAILERVAKTNKRCKKLGLPEMTIVENRRWVEDHYLGMKESPDEEYLRRVKAPIIVKPYVDAEGRVTRYAGQPAFYAVLEWAEIKIAGEAPKLAGWSLLARVEGFPGGNLLHCVPGAEIPAEFRTRNAQDCDHCHAARIRKDTFILRHEDGTYKMVGRNCIKDFLGHNNPNDILWLFTQYMEALPGEGGGEPWDGEDGFGSGVATIFDSVELVAVTAAKVETSGFVSRKASEESNNPPTAEAVRAHFQEKPRKLDDGTFYDPRIPFEPRHLELAAKMITWVKGTTDSSEYMTNMRLIFNHPDSRIKVKHIGYACSVVSAYNKEMEITDVRQRHGADWAAKIAKSEYVGAVGAKIEAEVMLVSVKPFEGSYGTTLLMTFEDRNTNVLTWWASGGGIGVSYFYNTEVNGAWVALIGSWFKIKGTVKKAEEYKGLKQTTLTRVKFISKLEEPKS